jgi:hypothetical protein
MTKQRIEYAVTLFGSAGVQFAFEAEVKRVNIGGINVLQLALAKGWQNVLPQDLLISLEAAIANRLARPARASDGEPALSKARECVPSRRHMLANIAGTEEAPQFRLGFRESPPESFLIALLADAIAQPETVFTAPRKAAITVCAFAGHRSLPPCPLRVVSVVLRSAELLSNTLWLRHLAIVSGPCPSRSAPSPVACRIYGPLLGELKSRHSVSGHYVAPAA